jgi:hypothetical protein
MPSIDVARRHCAAPVSAFLLHAINAKGDSGTLKGEKYKSTGVGAKYTIAPGLWTSLGYNTFSTTPATGAKQKGNGLRIRVHAGF